MALVALGQINANPFSTDPAQPNTAPPTDQFPSTFPSFFPPGPGVSDTPSFTSGAEDGTDLEPTPEVQRSVDLLSSGGGSFQASASAPGPNDVKLSGGGDLQASVATTSGDPQANRFFPRRRWHWVRKLRCKVYWWPYWKFCCWWVWYWVYY